MVPSHNSAEISISARYTSHAAELSARPEASAAPAAAEALLEERARQYLCFCTSSYVSICTFVLANLAMAAAAGGGSRQQVVLASCNKCRARSGRSMTAGYTEIPMLTRDSHRGIPDSCAASLLELRFRRLRYVPSPPAPAHPPAPTAAASRVVDRAVAARC